MLVTPHFGTVFFDMSASLVKTSLTSIAGILNLSRVWAGWRVGKGKRKRKARGQDSEKKVGRSSKKYSEKNHTSDNLYEAKTLCDFSPDQSTRLSQYGC